MFSKISWIIYSFLSRICDRAWPSELHLVQWLHLHDRHHHHREVHGHLLPPQQARAEQEILAVHPAGSTDRHHHLLSQAGLALWSSSITAGNETNFTHLGVHVPSPRNRGHKTRAHIDPYDVVVVLLPNFSTIMKSINLGSVSFETWHHYVHFKYQTISEKYIWLKYFKAKTEHFSPF